MVLKKVSIANLGFALASAPLLHYITSASGQGGKGSVMSALLITFGGATTGGLAWATGTYALNIWSVPGKEALRIETPTLTGGVASTEVYPETIQPSSPSLALALALARARARARAQTLAVAFSLSQPGALGAHWPAAGLPPLRDLRGQGRQVLVLGGKLGPFGRRASLSPPPGQLAEAGCP